MINCALIMSCFDENLSSRAAVRVLASPLCVTVSLVAWLACIPAQAACSRSDVDYYLDKGFTREQISALCGEGESPSRRDRDRYGAYDDPVERQAREVEKRRRKDEEIFFIKSAIAAQDIELTPRKLEYTRKFCLAVGDTPEVEGRTRVCPDVRYRIYFKNLEVGGYERKYYFLGRREIEITGRVQRKLMHDFREYPSDIRQKLLAAYKHATRKGATFIPVRKDVPIYRVTEILREYARRATGA